MITDWELTNLLLQIILIRKFQFLSKSESAIFKNLWCNGNLSKKLKAYISYQLINLYKSSSRHANIKIMVGKKFAFKLMLIP